MTPASTAVRKAALNRLAVATRERLPERAEDRDALFRVYLDDLGGFSDDTFVRACRRLETAVSWFPKKAELYDTCASVAKQKADGQRPRLALPSGVKEASAEQLADIRQRVRRAVSEKTMRTGVGRR